MTTSQSLVRKLHFHRELKQIWLTVQDGDVTRCRSFASAAKRLWAGGNPGPVYLLGTADNSPLICSLFEEFSRRAQQPQIYLGTPDVIETRSDWGQPTSIFASMDRLAVRRPSQGGWHLLTAKELPAYRLTALLGTCENEQAPSRLNQELLDLLRLHPAFHSLTFFESLDWLQTARLLATIVDPRWYVDPQNPDRLAKLRLYLGLTRQNVRAACMGAEDGGVNYRRSRPVFLTWQPGGALAASPADVLLPRQFLYRFCRNRVSKYDELDDAILRTTHLLIRFIVDVWLAKIATHPELASTDHLFDGDDPALRDATRFAFRQHMLSATSG